MRVKDLDALMTTAVHTVKVRAQLREMIVYSCLRKSPYTQVTSAFVASEYIFTYEHTNLRVCMR